MITKPEDIARLVAENEELKQLVSDLWDARGYGIKEMELLNRVSKFIPFPGLRPVNKNGVSFKPEIVGTQLSYTKSVFDTFK